MKRFLPPLVVAMVAPVALWARQLPDGLVLVEGGPFKNIHTTYAASNVTLPSFYLGKYEVTQKEWTDVMGSNPSQFHGDDLPVEMVSWYDCIDYCNRRSQREGLQPCYTIDRTRADPDNHTIIDDVKWTVTFNPHANGYRLPTEAEWEYAASGGQLSKGYAFSGSDDVKEVAWYWQNAGDKLLSDPWIWPVLQQNHNRTHPVGAKAPNELGLHDMSGNVREWCWDWFGQLGPDGAPARTSSIETGRVWKGGGWIGGDFCCAASFRGNHDANGRGPDQGLRVCRNAEPKKSAP